MNFATLSNTKALRWPKRLAKPVFAGDTHYMQLAMSILTGMEFLDGDRYGPLLHVEHAKDVCRWAGYEVLDYGS